MYQSIFTWVAICKFLTHTYFCSENLIKIIHENPIPTSQTTHCIFINETNWFKDYLNLMFIVQIIRNVY